MSASPILITSPPIPRPLTPYRAQDKSGTLALGELKAAIALILDPAADKTLSSLMESNQSMSKSIKKLRTRLAKDANRVIEM